MLQDHNYYRSQLPRQPFVISQEQRLRTKKAQILRRPTVIAGPDGWHLDRRAVGSCGRSVAVVRCHAHISLWIRKCPKVV